jgi:hypothetical protein
MIVLIMFGWLLIVVGFGCLVALLWQDFGPRPEPPWPTSTVFSAGLVRLDEEE